jgi:hypothetical protein
MASSCSGALPASQVRRAPLAKWIELRQPLWVARSSSRSLSSCSTARFAVSRLCSGDDWLIPIPVRVGRKRRERHVAEHLFAIFKNQSSLRVLFD